MNRKLFLFVIKTRISPLQIAFSLLAYILLGMIFSLLFSIAEFHRINMMPALRILVSTTAIVILFYMYQQLARRVFIKTDMDFLLNYGVSPRELVIAFAEYASFVLIIPTVLLFWVILLVTDISLPWYATLCFFSMVYIGAILGFMLRFVSNRKIAGIQLLAVGLFGISNIVGIPLNPVDSSGNLWIYSVFALLVIIILSYLEVSNLIRHVDCITVHLVRRNKQTSVTSPLRFSKWNRKYALIRFFSTVTVLGYFKLRRDIQGRISLRSFVIYIIAMSFITVLLSLLPGFIQRTGQLFSLITVIVISILIYYVIIIFLISLYSIINERLWISWNVVEPGRSVQIYIIGRLIFAVLSLIPVIIFFLAQYFRAIESGISVSYLIPYFSAILLFYPFYVFAILLNIGTIRSKIKEGVKGYVQLSDLIYLPLLVAYLAMLLLSQISLQYMASILLGTYLVMFLILIQKRFMEMVFFKMVEHGLA